MLQFWLPEHTHFIDRATLAATLPTRSSLLAEVIRKVIREEIHSKHHNSVWGNSLGPWGSRRAAQPQQKKPNTKTNDILHGADFLRFPNMTGGLCSHCWEEDPRVSVKSEWAGVDSMFAISSLGCENMSKVYLLSLVEGHNIHIVACNYSYFIFCPPTKNDGSFLVR